MSIDGRAFSSDSAQIQQEKTLLARAYLSRVCEPGNLDLWSLVENEGAIAAASMVRDGRVSDAIASATQARRNKVDPYADMEAAEAHDIRILAPELADWPQLAFAPLTKHASTGRTALVPPLALWVKGQGNLEELAFRAVALVGSRAATSYGERVTADLAYGLARAGVTIVSGGAYGIDAVAHRSALTAGGLSVLVSAGGLDRPYPSGNATLFDRVADEGLLVSESPPGSAPHRHRFLSRNRLIAAFSSGTVIVEAARRSGALNTASHARAMGRPVMAVPGPVTSAMSVGCHDLLQRDQAPALLVTSARDVLTGIGAYSDAGGVGSPDNGLNPIDELDAVSRRVLDAFPSREAVSEDRLAYLSGLPTTQVMRSLPLLRLTGLVQQVEGRWALVRRS